MAMLSQPRISYKDPSGTPYPGALARFYQSGTSTPVLVYQDALYQTPHAVPVVQLGDGYFPQIYFREDSGDLKAVFTDKDGGNSKSIDPINSTLGSADLWATLNGLTVEEVAEGLTDVDYSYPLFSVERYRADPTGEMDATAAFNTAFRVGERTSGVTIFSASGARFKIIGTLTPVIDKVGFDGKGCVLDSRQKLSVNGDQWVPTFSNPLLVARVSHVSSHPIENFTSYGPGFTQNCRMMYFTDGSADNVGCGVRLKNGGSIDWKTHLEYGAGAFFEAPVDWNFDSQTTGSTNHVIINAATNSGERNSFTRCRFGGSGGYNIVQLNGNASTMYTDCSWNYGEAGYMDLQAGSAHIVNCHIEGNNDTVYWFKASGSNTTLHVSNCMLAITGVKTNFAPFRSESTVTAGGVFIDKMLVGSSLSMSVPLVSGTGNANVTNITTYESGSQPAYYAPALNRLSDGSFEGALTKDGWVLSGATPPATSTSNPRSGTYSLRVAGINTEQNKAKLVYPCRPGEVATGECYMALTDYGTGGNFIGTLTYQDAAGNTLHQSAFRSATANLAYTRTQIGSHIRAPAGTKQVEIAFEFFGVTTGTPFGYVDDLVVNVQ
jgi:hypothetical protein